MASTEGQQPERRSPSRRRRAGSPVIGKITLADGQRLYITDHCVERFWQRAAPGFPQRKHAHSRLWLLSRAIGAFEEPPAWAGEPEKFERWVALGPDVGLVVSDRCAVTCLARGAMRADRRAARNRRRQQRARARREARIARAAARRAAQEAGAAAARAASPEHGRPPRPTR